MTLTTSKGKTFDIDWMWGPLGPDEYLMLEYADDRPLSKIAKDFEGCKSFHRESDTEGDMDWKGYTDLCSIGRAAPGKVQILLRQPE